MPLIVMSGIPCSGKSHITSKIRHFFSETKGIETIVVTDEQKLNESKRDVIYANASMEKQLRGWLKSQIDRYLNSNKLVIIDAPNYIKGYRYELYCLSKERKSTHCVIECATPFQLSWDWNCQRDDSMDKYCRDIFDALIQRYEPPDSRNRWDSPLFVINYRDDIPFDQIHVSLYGTNAPQPNQSTQTQPLTSTNFLYELDCKTQEVVRITLIALQNGQLNDIVIPQSKDTLNLKSVLSHAQLGRLRRQFINYTKMHPIDDVKNITNMFVIYLNTSQ